MGRKQVSWAKLLYWWGNQGFCGKFYLVDLFVVLPYSCSISWWVFLVLCYYQLLPVWLFQYHPSGLSIFGIIILQSCRNFVCQSTPEKLKIFPCYNKLHNRNYSSVLLQCKCKVIYLSIFEYFFSLLQCWNISQY